MSSRDLFRVVFKKERTTRPPVWMMRQAGRHLPEYRKIREGKTFETLLFDADLTAEVTLQPVRRYDLDAAIIFSDILLPFYGMDRGMQIVPGTGPHIADRVRTPDDVSKLKVPSDEIYDSLVKGLEKVREELPEKAVIGFAGAPYTLSSYLIEGKSTRDSLITKTFAESNPESYCELMEFLVKIVSHQLELQVEQGVDFIQIFDTWATHLSAAQYRKFALPHMERLVRKFTSKLPVIVYARGSSHLLSVLAETNATGYSIDHTLTIREARAILGDNAVIQGNLDPAYLFIGGAEMESKVDEIVNMGKESPGHIFNLSQGVNKDTPVEYVTRVINRVKGGTNE